MADVEAALAANDPRAALTLLETLRPEDAEARSQALFLEGLAALGIEDYDRAIAALEALVTREPSQARPRLELARAYFLKGDDANAKRQFELVRGGDLPPATIANIDFFLSEIEARRRWSFRGGLAIAPDTNVNGATSAATVGLPVLGGTATIADEDQAQTGLGLEVNLGATVLTRPDDSAGRWRATADLFTQTYGEDRFNAELVTLTAARLIAGPSHLLAAGVESVTQYADGEIELQDLTLTGDWTRQVSPRLELTGGARAGGRHFAQTDTALRIAGASAGVTYALTSASRVGAALDIDEAQGEARSSARTQVSLQALYYAETSAGVTFALRPRASFARYHAPDTLFSVERRVDRTLALPVQISHRTLRLRGFQPYLQVTLEQRRSVASIFEYDRQRAVLGLSRQF
ncbi:MAG: surface lipoprotein assembly modifier [Pseudomonadota bacterium]